MKKLCGTVQLLRAYSLYAWSSHWCIKDLQLHITIRGDHTRIVNGGPKNSRCNLNGYPKQLQGRVRMDISGWDWSLLGHTDYIPTSRWVVTCSASWPHRLFLHSVGWSHTQHPAHMDYSYIPLGGHILSILPTWIIPTFRWVVTMLGMLASYIKLFSVDGRLDHNLPCRNRKTKLKPLPPPSSWGRVGDTMRYLMVYMAFILQGVGLGDLKQQISKCLHISICEVGVYQGLCNQTRPQAVGHLWVLKTRISKSPHIPIVGLYIDSGLCKVCINWAWKNRDCSDDNMNKSKTTRLTYLGW